MKVLSLFDGISCGRVALERLNIKVDKYVAYEIDSKAIEVSKNNFNDIIHMGDVFNADFKGEYYDILLGGSPCTHWSIARGGNNRETKASGIGWELFKQFVRALKEVKPKYFLYENNYSMSDNIKEQITKELGVQPIMIDSGDFSAQLRKRYYWTNIQVDLNYKKCDSILDDIIYKHDYNIKSFDKYSSTVKWNKDRTICKWDTSGRGNYSQQNRARVTSIKSNTLPSSGSDKNNIYMGGYNYRNIHPIEAERLQTLDDNYTSCIKSINKRIELVGNGWTIEVIKYILSFIK